MKNAEKIAKELAPIGEVYFRAKAYTQLMREEVDKQAMLVLESIGLGNVEPKDTWKLSHDVFEVYHRKMQDWVKNNYPDTEEGCCPALVAEGLERDAARNFIDAFEPYTGLNFDIIMRSGGDCMKNKDKALRLISGMVAPIVKKRLGEDISLTLRANTIH